MNNYLTYFNIDWKKYLHIFDLYDNVQIICLIPPKEANNCFYLGNINITSLLQIYDITNNKINKLQNIGPYIVRKNHILNFDKNEEYNIEKAIIRFHQKNKYFRWIGVAVESDFLPNIFTYLLTPSYNIAYLIPFRNRDENLQKTIVGLKKYIKSKNLDADIIVVQQNKFGNWNKGCTCNVGFNILKDHYDYFVFNDADTYPEENTPFVFPRENEIIHIYGYNYCLGGVFSCHKNTFTKINGFNNNFFNWGREDRDLEDRCKKNNIKVNRDHQIKIKKEGIQQLNHENDVNYWNFSKDDNNFNKARQLYYFNQIQHYNNKKDGLNNLLKDSFKILDNRKIVFVINLKSWTTGEIKVKSDVDLFNINTFPKEDTGILRIKYDKNEIELPINPEEKYPKMLIEMYYEKGKITVNIKYSYFFDKKFNLISESIDNIDVEFKNIEVDFYNIYTPFNNNTIKYNYYLIYKKEYYLINIKF
jgi:hypothetical protein